MKKKLQICLLRIPDDIECWISPFVLEDAGYEIMSEHDIDMKGGLQQAWYKTKYNYPVIICTHSESVQGVIVRNPKRFVDSGMVYFTGGEYWTHETLLTEKHPKENQLHKLFTCFLDFEKQTPTEFINLPGYDVNLQPGYWQVTNMSCSVKYRQWLGNLKAASRLYPNKKIKELFQIVVLPKLSKYAKLCNTPWSFAKITTFES
jgi:hypothetical protein